MAAVDVVIATRDRRELLLATLAQLQASDAATVMVVDNASGDGSATAVASSYPMIRVVRLPRNIGAAARNAGVALSSAPYVAFSDDDSWWGPGALNRAAAILDANPRLALVGARVLVGPGRSVDPVSVQMAASGLARRGGPGPSILGFVACGAIVRRSAFLAVGGFSMHYGIGGEEELLALDLRAAGWHLAYCDDVVAHHCPVAGRDPQPRRRRQARNALWTTWLRRPVPVVVRHTAGVLAAAPQDRTVRGGLGDAAACWRWALTNRCPIPRSVEVDLRVLAGRAGVG